MCSMQFNVVMIEKHVLAIGCNVLCVPQTCKMCGTCFIGIQCIMVMLLLNCAGCPLHCVSTWIVHTRQKTNQCIHSHRGKSRSTYSFIVHHGTSYRQLQ